MTYRNEIDGLRAIAVFGVILYHAGFGFMGSGYAGVDIFFVISGYLIGGQILSDLAAGTFRFREFYARRARRILPALFAMIAATCAAGAFILLPHDFRYLFGAAVTALLSLSNFWLFDVEVTTLDKLWRERINDRIGLLKVDVEGFEADVLEGAAHLLDNRLIDAVVFEFSPTIHRMRGLVPDAPLRVLRDHGYEVFTLDGRPVGAQESDLPGLCDLIARPARSPQ